MGQFQVSFLKFGTLGLSVRARAFENFKTSGSGRLRAVGFFKLRARVPSGWPKSGLNGSGFRARATLTHH